MVQGRLKQLFRFGRDGSRERLTSSTEKLNKRRKTYGHKGTDRKTV